MNEVVLKEFKKEYFWIKAIFYILFTIAGFMLLRLSKVNIENPIRYVPIFFYTFAFLSLLTYFGNRTKGNYELLFFGLINVMTGTFVLVNIYYPNKGFILADSVLLYSILNVINSGYTCYKLYQEKNLSVFMKAAITIMLLFLGAFVITTLYEKVEVTILILGYYYTAYGLLELLDVFTNVLLNDKRYKRKLLSYINYDEDKKEEIKEIKETPKKVVKNRTIKKIKRK